MKKPDIKVIVISNKYCGKVIKQGCPVARRAENINWKVPEEKVYRGEVTKGPHRHYGRQKVNNNTRRRKKFGGAIRCLTGRKREKKEATEKTAWCRDRVLALNAK